MANLAKHLDKSAEALDLADLVKAPVSALAGISEADAEALSKAFGIQTIGELGTNKYFLRAQAIVELAI